MDDQVIKLTFRTDTSTVKSGTADVKALKAATDELATGMEKAGKSTQNLGQAGLTAGRALQDFTQGGIGGILNNIEGLTTALGGGPGLAGIFTAVGVAAFIAKPYLAKFFEEATTKIPPTLEGLSSWNDRLKDIGKRLDELREKQNLTNDEMVEYNKLTAEQIDLQKKKAEAEEKAKTTKAIEGIEGTEFQKRAAGFKAGVAEAGGGEYVRERLVEAFMKTGFQAEAGRDPEEWIREQIEKQMKGAMAGSAINRQYLIEALSKRGGAFGRGIAEDIWMESPEYKEAQKAQEEADQGYEAGFKERSDAVKKRNTARKKAKDEENDLFKKVMDQEQAIEDEALRTAERQWKKGQQAAEQSVSAEQMIEQREAGIIQANAPPGTTPGEAAAAGKRAVDLMQQQWGEQQALTQAMNEMLAAMQQNGMLWQALRMQADRVTAEMRDTQARNHNQMVRPWGR